jgi:hypothetical protein
MMPNVHGLVSSTLGAHKQLSTAVMVLMAASVLIWVAIAVPRRCSASCAISLAITASVFVSYYLFVYDLPVLLLPLIIALNGSTTTDNAGSQRLMRWSCVLLFLAPGFLLLLSSYFYLVSLFALFFLIACVRSAKNEARTTA